MSIKQELVHGPVVWSFMFVRPFPFRGRGDETSEGRKSREKGAGEKRDSNLKDEIKGVKVNQDAKGQGQSLKRVNFYFQNPGGVYHNFYKSNFAIITFF